MKKKNSSKTRDTFVGFRPCVFENKKHKEKTKQKEKNELKFYQY